jgi:NTP pyrophosphatase (non-canonical NTP hydrolase)
MKTFEEYEQRCQKLSFYTPGDITYATLGLCGEAGEFAEKVKKFRRDGTYDRRLMLLELGDVAWYLQACARELGSSLSEVSEMNIAKLESRNARGTQRGSGDDR